MKPGLVRWFAALLLGLVQAVIAQPVGGGPSAAKQGPRFDLPIRCTPGQDCFVQNYFDRDPGSGWRDYACGLLSYDGHHGTDFRLPSLARMERGVEVLAAAPGRVVAVRDGEPDISLRDRPPGSVAGREAGNAVRIDHGDGWETQYSHMKRGSVRVRPGQHVQTGDALGLVGLSGKTEFPHVDFVVRRDGRAIDPFDPQPREPVADDASGDSKRDSPQVAQTDRPCATGPGEASVWRADLARTLRYVPTGVLIAGFAPGAVERARAQREEYPAKIDAGAPMLVFWFESFGVRAGDHERIEIEAPDGQVLLSTDRPIQASLAVRFGYSGRRLTGARWPAGVYVGRYRIVRGAEVIAQARREVLIR